MMYQNYNLIADRGIKFGVMLLKGATPVFRDREAVVRKALKGIHGSMNLRA